MLSPCPLLLAVPADNLLHDSCSQRCPIHCCFYRNCPHRLIINLLKRYCSLLWCCHRLLCWCHHHRQSHCSSTAFITASWLMALYHWSHACMIAMMTICRRQPPSWLSPLKGFTSLLRSLYNSLCCCQHAVFAFCQCNSSTSRNVQCSSCCHDKSHQGSVA